MGGHEHGGGATTFLPFGVALAGLLVCYMGAALRQRRRGRRWSNWRILTFAAALAILGIAGWPGMADFAHRDLRFHMVQHLLVGMVAPVGLVLGMPLTLALRTLPRSGAATLFGILCSLPLRFLSHPVTALVINIGGMYLLYLTPLYRATLSSGILHHFVHFHFLAAGTLFAWAIIGGDPGAPPSSFKTRFVVLFLSMATHATLGKVMYAYVFPRGTPHPLEEILAAAQIMYYGGDLAEVLLAFVLLGEYFGRYHRELLLQGRDEAMVSRCRS